MKLWRQAVLIHHNHTDPLSHWCDPTGESLQCHHVIPRKHFVTRWDVLNGVPLTVESHAYAHTLGGRRALEDALGIERMSYLWGMGRWFKKDYLLAQGVSEREFRESIKAQLKELIEEAA